MHVGNARTALLAWLDARARGGRMLLRIEDLDRERSRPQHAEGIRHDLRWLGLDWDAETPPQSAREPGYARAIERLAAAGHIYECYCTRKQLAVASAPHGDGDEPAPYSGTCLRLTDAERERLRAQGRAPALRVRMPDRLVTIQDRVHGPVHERATRAGDPVVRRSDGQHAYQLAVVVDDAADGVSDVVRGDDLLGSTARQVALQQLLGLPPVAHAHVPLVLGPDGARLAKRHGSVTLAELRAAGADPARLVGWLAATAGVGGGGAATPAMLVAGFALASIERRPATVSAGDLDALAATTGS